MHCTLRRKHRCIDRGLAAEGRIMRFTVNVQDRPGGMVEMLKIVSDVGASVKEVQHDRMLLTAFVYKVALIATVETRGRENAQELVHKLKERYNDEVTFHTVSACHYGEPTPAKEEDGMLKTNSHLTKLTVPNREHGEARKNPRILLDEIIGYNADIVCLQELDSKMFRGEFYKTLESEGFEGVFSNKSASPEGTCALWRKKSFEKVRFSEYPITRALLDKDGKLFDDLREVVMKCKPVKKSPDGKASEKERGNQKSGQLILQLPHVLQVATL